MNTTNTSSQAADVVADGTVADWPLKFAYHQFEGFCFDTQSCEIRYNGFDFGNAGPTPPLSKLGPDQHDSILHGSYGPVPRTDPPAQVRWRSKDGTELQAEVDIAALFKDGLIRHHVPRDEISEGVSMGSTHILLQVADRTITVFTRTRIPTKELQDPANPYSSGRDDLIEVFSKTY